MLVPSTMYEFILHFRNFTIYSIAISLTFREFDRTFEEGFFGLNFFFLKSTYTIWSVTRVKIEWAVRNHQCQLNESLKATTAQWNFVERFSHS